MSAMSEPTVPDLIERLLNQGTQHFTTEELQSVILDLPASEIHHHLLNVLQAHDASHAIPRDLPGLTPAQIARIIALHEILERYRTIADAPEPLRAPFDVASYFQKNGLVGNYPHMHLLFLDAQYRPRNPFYQPIFRGIPTLETLPAATIYRDAVQSQARFIIFVFTDPAPNPEPNPEALRYVRKVAQNAKVLDLEILDCLTVGTEGFHLLSRHPHLW